MSIEDTSSCQERWEIYSQESAYVRKAQKEVDKAKQLLPYRLTTEFRDAKGLTFDNGKPAEVVIVFGDIEIKIPYRASTTRYRQLLGLALPFHKTGITRKVEHIEVYDDSDLDRATRDRYFSNTLPDLRTLIAFGGDFFKHNAHSWEHLADGGASLAPNDRGKYNAVNFSVYILDALTFTPESVDFRLEWGKYPTTERLKIDTRYLATLDGKRFLHPQTQDQWRSALEQNYQREKAKKPQSL
ncbi:MAG: hypothetical protein G01um10145_576 [Microgenomates group bacterium Gr01-1014_5]|nr:MAG: hypothetical protein G01um10145_576 [Microgenomates group bacterium Gr01-1014_5]